MPHSKRREQSVKATCNGSKKRMSLRCTSTLLINVIHAQIILFHHPHKRILVVHDNSTTIGVFFLRGIPGASASNYSEERRICTFGGC
jgi:hypothetical protein